MLKKGLLFIGCFLFSVVALCASENKSYVNHQWDFQINIPKGWSIAESNEIIKSIESKSNISPQSLTAIRNSGLIVNISRYPFDSKTDFNPNISISAKNIEITLKPKSDKEVYEFAKQILVTMAMDKEKTFSPEQVKVNGLFGVKSNFQFKGQKNQEADVEVMILVDRQKNNYFIITSTYRDKEEYANILQPSINSFKKL